MATLWTLREITVLKLFASPQIGERAAFNLALTLSVPNFRRHLSSAF